MHLSFGGNGVWTHVNSKGKIPSTGKFPQRRIEPATLWTASPNTTNQLFRPHYFGYFSASCSTTLTAFLTCITVIIIIVIKFHIIISITITLFPLPQSFWRPLQSQAKACAEFQAKTMTAVLPRAPLPQTPPVGEQHPDYLQRSHSVNSFKTFCNSDIQTDWYTGRQTQTENTHTHMPTYARTLTDMRSHTHTNTHARTHTNTHVYTHTHTHTHTYLLTYARRSRWSIGHLRPLAIALCSGLLSSLQTSRSLAVSALLHCLASNCCEAGLSFSFPVSSRSGLGMWCWLLASWGCVWSSPTSSALSAWTLVPVPLAPTDLHFGSSPAIWSL